MLLCLDFHAYVLILKVAPKSEPAMSEAAKKVEDIEKELELDLENLNIDENIDTSVS